MAYCCCLGIWIWICHRPRARTWISGKRCKRTSILICSSIWEKGTWKLLWVVVSVWGLEMTVVTRYGWSLIELLLWHARVWLAGQGSGGCPIEFWIKYVILILFRCSVLASFSRKRLFNLTLIIESVSLILVLVTVPFVFTPSTPLSWLWSLPILRWPMTIDWGHLEFVEWLHVLVNW